MVYTDHLKMPNITGFFFEPSKQCFNWCREQHFIHANNLQIQDLTLVVLSMIALLLMHLIEAHHDNIDVKQETLEKIYNALSHFAFYILVVFFTWFIFFR